MSLRGEGEAMPGGRKPTISDEALLECLRDALAATDAPVVETIDVAERADLGRSRTAERLRSLSGGETGVAWLQVGSGYVWWIEE